MLPTEVITWYPVIDPRTKKPCLPDEGITVLVKTPSRGEPVWPGYLEDGEWSFADGSASAYKVTHWAEMPVGPKS